MVLRRLTPFRVAMLAVVLAGTWACSPPHRHHGDEGSPCTTTEDCDEGLVCFDEVCTVPGEECDDGEVPCSDECCEIATQYCDVDHCEDNEDCVSGNLCNGECCLAADSCTDDGCCAPESTCSNSCCGAGQVCVDDTACEDCPTVICAGACCAEGEDCFAGVCCTEERQCGASCCDDDERCESGECVLACTGTERCGPAGEQVCCGEEEICYLEECRVPGDPCERNDECPEGEYCETTLGRCLPLAPGTEECVSDPPVHPFTPALQCSFSDPPADDLTPSAIQVFSFVVGDFDFDNDPDVVRPSVVFIASDTSNYTGLAVVRVIDGETCEHQFSLNTDPADTHMNVEAYPAVGDIDGDGRADILSPDRQGGLHAFRYDPEDGAFVRMWESRNCATSAPDSTYGQWAPPSIHDLDDDGLPEILYGGTYYDNAGCVLGTVPGFSYFLGLEPVVVDIDEDGRMELVTGVEIDEFDPGTRTFVRETYFPGTTQGRVAVADFGDYPLSSLDIETPPEIGFIMGTGAQIVTMEGTVVFGPIPLPGGGAGGPPTVSDFDGDGYAELAGAALDSYAIFDPDCVASPPAARPGGACPTGTTSSILWSQPSQDHSSNMTGSSIFDFEGDGQAEAIYSDECFTRVYEGPTGRVIWSVTSQSATVQEYPVIVDVDGDFHSEIVMAINSYWDPSCPATDPLYDGGPCDTGEDCAGFGTTCVAGTCRAEKVTGQYGIWIYADIEDRWVNSRPVWNQHVYYVTNVNDDSTIPRTSEVERNWDVEGLNNFRENILREGRLNAPDVVPADLAVDVLACPTRYVLYARVANEGAAGVTDGIPVGFYVEPEGGEPMLVGVARTTRPILPGMSERVELTWTPTEDVQRFSFWVVVDDPDAPGGEVALRECHEDNNVSDPIEAECGTIG